MLKDYPDVIYLDKNTSHNSIIKLQPECVVTNHGTLAHEYAYFKIPVINTMMIIILLNKSHTLRRLIKISQDWSWGVEDTAPLVFFGRLPCPISCYNELLQWIQGSRAARDRVERPLLALFFSNIWTKSSDTLGVDFRALRGWWGIRGGVPDGLGWFWTEMIQLWAERRDSRINNRSGPLTL